MFSVSDGLVWLPTPEFRYKQVLVDGKPFNILQTKFVVKDQPNIYKWVDVPTIKDDENVQRKPD